MGINVAVLAISWIVTAVLSAQINPVDNPAYLAQYLSQVYCSPVCHITPYCIGILLAYWIHKEGEIGEEDCEGNSKWPVAHLILAAILMLAVTFLPVLWHNKRLGNSLLGLLYSTFHQSIFAFAWALVIWVSVGNHVPILNRIFAANFIQILSKLSYQAYIIHFPFYIFVMSNSEQQGYSYDYFSLDAVCFIFPLFSNLIEFPRFSSKSAQWFSQSSSHWFRSSASRSPL